MTSLQGKRALVTGASGALGSAIAERLARDGATVLLHANGRRDAIEALAARIVASGGQAECHVFDLTSDEGTAAACARILEDEVELAVGVFPHVPAGISRSELYRDVLVCVADKDNPRLKGGRMDERSYLESPHVTVAPNLDSGVQLDEIFESMGFARRVVVTVPHYTALPGLVGGTDLVAHTRRRLVSIIRTAANLTVFPIPAPFRVPELCFEQIWHPRYERDPGHRWLRDLIAATVSNKRR